MSGGVDSRALETPRKIFAAARNTDGVEVEDPEFGAQYLEMADVKHYDAGLPGAVVAGVALNVSRKEGREIRSPYRCGVCTS